MGELKGQVAIVTGSARNIGRSIAERIAAAGAAVVINARQSQAEAELVASEIVARGGRAIAVVADVTKQDSVEDLIGAAITSFGRLDILVNNAALRMDAPIEEIAFNQWRAVLASILDAAFLCSQAALPHLKRNGSGTIVNIGGGCRPYRRVASGSCCGGQGGVGRLDTGARCRGCSIWNNSELHCARTY